jgi:hypothetical protein
MLVQVRKVKTKIAIPLVLFGASMFVSCASQKEKVALVKDPDQKSESMVPWNKQEKWEAQGQFSGITDRR